MAKDIVLGVKCGGNPNWNGHDCNVAIKFIRMLYIKPPN